MSLLATRPPRTEIASTETVTLECDMAALLASGETVLTPVVSLINVATGASYAGGLSGSPSVTGTRIRQSVTALVAGQRYRVIWTMTPVAGKIVSCETLLEVPF